MCVCAYVCEYPDGTKSLKLGDFGLATVVEGPLYTVCGTPTYVAPEIIAETGYGLKVDVWAAGVITYILLCGFPPFRSENNLQEDLFDQILAGKLEFPAPYWDNITDSAKELISQMLQVNVEARCTAGQILSHPWVSVSTHVPGGPTSLCPVGRSGPPRLGCGADRGLGPRSVAPWASFSVVTLPALWRMRRAPGPS
ncbi:hypothetical protein Celaphus_00000549, partial [Cervus elaphus hippelaphus]